MATLRDDNYFIRPEASRISQQDLDALEASGMTEFGRTFTGGRIGTDANALRVAEMNARAAGDIAGADEMRAQIDELQQRQEMYAPSVRRVEDIDGIGSGLRWGAGAFGQAAASMLDPIALGTGLGVAGRVASAIPHPFARAAGGVLRGLAVAAPVGVNVNQMTGEAGNEFARDSEIMARHTPTDLRNAALGVGAVSGLGESIIPGVISRQLSGAGLRAGVRGMGPAAKTGLGMLGEGTVELGQGKVSQYARGTLNPNRDTSGDFSEDINNFAGGLVGSGPLVAAGAYADQGYRRVGDTTEKLGQKAGDVVDLLGDKAAPYVEQAKEAVGRAKDAGVDLLAGKDGKITRESVLQGLKSTGEDLMSGAQSALNERDVLNDTPPADIVADDAKAGAWFTENAPKRAQLVADKLQAMGEDPEAQAHLDAIQSQDPQAQAAAVDEAARFVLDRTPLGRAEARASALGESLGKLAGVVGPAIGKGAVAVGKAALGFGKAVLSGAKEGLAKKNEQSNEVESFGAWRDRYYGVEGQAAAKQVLDQAADDRADLAGNYAADMAKRLSPRAPNLALLAKHAAFIMADMTMQAGAKGLGAQNARMNRLVGDLHGAFKAEAPEVLRQLGTIMGPKAAPVVEYMAQELEQQMAPAGQRRATQMRDELAQQVVSLIDPAAQNSLLGQGINLNTPKGREQVLGLMEDYADGIGSKPGMREAYDGVFGADSTGRILELLNGVADTREQIKVGSVVDDRKQTGQENLDPNADDEGSDTNAFDQRVADKLVGTGAGPKVFGFHATPTLRTSSERSDAFGLTKKTAVGETATRPLLFRKGQQLSPESLKTLTKGMTINERAAWMKDPQNTGAAAKKIADVRKQLQEDPAYPDHDNYDVREVPADQVMKDANMQPTKILQLYRDYLLMDGNTERSAQAGALLAKVVRITKGTNKWTAEEMDRAEAWMDKNPGKDITEFVAAELAKLDKPLANAVKEARAYFSQYSVVVGEQISNRDPSKIAVTEMLDMNREGQGLIERSRLAEDPKAKLSDANLLMFKTKSGEVAIPAGKLVNWVLQQRGKDQVSSAEDTGGSRSNRSKDDAYLADVMEGVAALIGSGHVQGMPYKMNPNGYREAFPSDSLRLATTTYGAMNFGEAKRREGRQVSDEKFQGADQEDVAADQDRNDEMFVADDRAERDLVVDDAAQKTTRLESNQAVKFRRRNSDGAPVGSVAVPRGDTSGQRVADPKTDDDGKTPIDFGKKPKDGVPDEYANQRWLSQQTGASTDASIGPEPKGTAASSAEWRADKINEAFLRSPEEGQAMVRQRIRMALRPGHTENKPEYGKFTVPGVAGKDQVVGGVHYIAPVAAFVGPKNLSKNNVDLDAGVIQAIQQKVAGILLGGVVSDAERVKIARLMLDGVTAFNVKAKLSALSAPEVVKAGLPKDQQTPSGAVKRTLDSRIRFIAEELVGDASPEAAEVLALSSAASRFVRRSLKSDGASRSVILANRGVARPLAKLVALRLLGNPYAARALNRFYMSLEQRETMRGDPDLNAAIASRLSAGTSKLGGYMRDIEAADVPQQFREIAQAVRKVAGNTPVYKVGAGKIPGNGQFDHASGDIKIKMSVIDINPRPSVVLHEGAHAATARALDTDPVLRKALYSLMAHVGGHDPLLLSAYGLTNSHEFLAEGLSNEGFQKRLMKVPPNAAVAKYLGATIANAWEAFVGVVRKALNLTPEHDSALMQLLDLAGRAMLVVNDVGVKSTRAEIQASTEFITVPARYFLKTLEELRAMPEMDDSARAMLDEIIKAEQGSTGVSHATALEADVVLVSFKELTRQIRQEHGESAPVLITADILDNLIGRARTSLLGTPERLASKAFPDAGRKLNAQDAREGNSKIATQKEMDEAKAYALKVLGPKISVAFKDITGYSGEFIDAKNVIEISTTAAAGTMNTLFHEAMHKFFKDFVKGNPRVQAMFESLINDPKHLAKLHALLDGYPAAQAQLSSGEERLAYTYQFWKAGLLSVDAKANTWLQKIGKFFRQVLGMVRDSERALELFQAFDNGKMSEPSAAGRVIAAAMDRGTNAIKLRRTLDGLTQGLAKLTFPSGVIFSSSLSPTARLLGPMMFTNPGDESHGGKGEGLINAQRAVSLKYINLATSALVGLTESDQRAVQKYLQSGVLPKDVPLAEHREAVKAIRDALERFHEHMVGSGMSIGKITTYYPTVWSAGALLAKKGEFIALLTGKYAQHLGKNPALGAERIWQSLVDKEGVDTHLPAGREDGVLAPFFASQEGRTLPWFEDVDKETFLDKDMVNTLTRYFHQGARASEYFRRFGENGIVLEKMLVKINRELSHAGTEKMKRGEIKDEKARVKWVARQMRDISQSAGAMEGTLGKDMSPNMRQFNSWMVVYQNIRLLPTMIFSSFVDPLGITARGSPLQAAFESFVYAMKGVVGAWADTFRDMPPERAADEWRDLAEHIGVVEVAMFSHHVGDQYSSIYMTPLAKKLNDKLFRFNGMEALNRSMRIMATKWATRFIEKNATLQDKVHSSRWLAELGLKPDMITLDAEGKLVTNRHELMVLKGITMQEATQQMAPIHEAIRRWVDGAIITPSAGQRPGWMSDPNFTVFGHLKQFSYAFQQTQLLRAVNEFKHGNAAPVGALAMFIPTMITADILKGLVQGHGSLPPYMAGMNAGDHIINGVQRAGLLGIGEIGADATSDWASLGGPAFEQAIDAMRDGMGSKSQINALPLHGLYAQALK